MSPADSPPTQQPPAEAPVSSAPRRAVKWTLTREAFDSLLERFSPDRQEAGRQYEMMRAKLLRFFEWRSCHSPEDAVDTTINRVARKIQEGAIITNLTGYCLEVGRNVNFEYSRLHESVALDDLPEMPAEPLVADEQKETRLRCLDECLDKQSPDARQLILDYYVDAQRAKIDHRRQLAQASTMNALRIRACRIRKGLEKCVQDCVERGRV